jgi:hypothetical protein
MSYAPADFNDMADMQPLDVYFDVGGHGSATPYADAIGAMLNKHLEEVQGKAATATGYQALASPWRRRIRDFMAHQNTELLNFIDLRMDEHCTMGRGEALLHRFGNPQVVANSSHPSIRNFVLDCSGAAAGADAAEDISAAIESFRGQGGIKDYIEATRLLYDEYKLAGEAVLKAQSALDTKIGRLDKAQSKIRALFDVEENEEQGQLLAAGERYLKRVYESNRIEADYKDLVAAYRRFVILRDIVAQTRFVHQREGEILCSICMQDPVAFAATPCGHTYCGPCLRKQLRSCCMCRAEIKEKVKLFL